MMNPVCSNNSMNFALKVWNLNGKGMVIDFTGCHLTWASGVLWQVHRFSGFYLFANNLRCDNDKFCIFLFENRYCDS